MKKNSISSFLSPSLSGSKILNFKRHGFKLIKILGIIAQMGFSPPLGTTDEDIRNLVNAGHELQALKWYRTFHSVSLVEAKSAIEKMKTK